MRKVSTTQCEKYINELVEIPIGHYVATYSPVIFIILIY